jgi:hypothetical protein
MCNENNHILLKLSMSQILAFAIEYQAKIIPYYYNPYLY